MEYKQRKIRSGGALARGIAFFLLVGLSLPLRASEPARPNFVFVLGEGHGWSSTSVQMDDAAPESKSAFVDTPNLEALAQGGMRFANFYAPSPRCTPSRATFFTGQSPARLHMTFVGEGKGESGLASNGRIVPPTAVMELPSGATTLAELLRRAGYATAHFGKWHLGRADPREHGYDESDGPNNNGGPDNVENPHPKQLFLMTERGLDFMARQVKAGKPFYLQLDHYASRRGGDARPESVAEVKRWGGGLGERDTETAAADRDLDVAFGMVLKKLDELGVAGNTYVIFTTDHGTPGKNVPFAGGKGTVTEGGLRVPFIVRGPGVKAGACSHVRIVGADLLPTLAELANLAGPLPKGVEGGSFAGVLAAGGAGAVKRPREEYVVHFPHYDKDPIGPASALYLGDLKLVRAYESGALKLFDIAKDPGERRDLAQEMPDKARELDARLSDTLASVRAQMPSPKQNDVPAHPLDVVLARPTRDAVTASVLAYREAEGSIAYGTRPDALTEQTAQLTFKKDAPSEIVLGALRPDTQYFYQLRAGGTKGAVGTFRTQRAHGAAFTFTITADPHLDEHTSPEVLRRTLANARDDEPDFHIDLGDTFMTEKHPSREAAYKQYLAQRYYFGSLCSSAPLFLVLGNHDGENPRGRDEASSALAVWSCLTRKALFPNPVPDGFYTGNAARHPEAGLLQDYYAWEWGDALFVALDPYWYTRGTRGERDNWSRTLGDEQYQWLARTLEGSQAKYKFVFIHHLVSGADEQARGGAEAAPLYEWGGRNADGTDGFAEHRPGWPLPVHQLLVANRVSVVFHGHDHLYARQELDGLIYQACPQPGDPRGSTRSAAAYGYTNGVLLASSGHLRVSVAPEQATVTYVRNNGSIAHTYTVLPKR